MPVGFDCGGFPANITYRRYRQTLIFLREHSARGPALTRMADWSGSAEWIPTASSRHPAVNALTGLQPSDLILRLRDHLRLTVTFAAVLFGIHPTSVSHTATFTRRLINENAIPCGQPSAPARTRTPNPRSAQPTRHVGPWPNTRHHRVPRDC